MTPRRNAILGALLLLLTGSLVANALLYRKASRPLFDEGDRWLIERTIARSLHPAQLRAETSPIVMHMGGRNCVELRRHDGLGGG